MRILYYDCFAGISGDMNLAAMIDLGVDPNYLGQELKKLELDDEFELITQKVNRNNIYGTRVDVQLTNKHPHTPHRNFADISRIITASKLSDEIKKTSLNIFTLIAEAYIVFALNFL